MKKFKSLIKNLQEDGAQSFGGSVFNGFNEPTQRSALSDRGLHYAHKEAEQLNRLNMVVSGYLEGRYVDPKEALKELSSRISVIGYTMNINNNTPLVLGINNIPIKVFGDKFGTTPTTDLTKEPFDTGADYPDLNLSFMLSSTKRGYTFTDVYVESSECTSCPGKIGQEEDNTNINTPIIATSVSQQNESYITEEKDPARVLELYLSKNTGKRILQPIYQSLKSLKKRGKYSKEIALKRFRYAVSAAHRDMVSSGKNISHLDDAQSERAANRLLFNFEKQIKSIED